MVVYREYVEGSTAFISADIDYYTTSVHHPTSELPIFYNPRMKVNRDLSVLVLDAIGSRKEIHSICEPFGGCGVRTLRYLRECRGDFVAHVFDINPVAVETIRQNVLRYDLQDRVRILSGDARRLLMDESRGRGFDMVDVDPFGSPAPYLPYAVQSIGPNGGLVAATATDMPVLCGVYPRVALRKYGGLSIRAPFSKEIAIRLLFSLLFHAAGMADMSIRPLVSLSDAHYVRIWAWVSRSCVEANTSSKEIGILRYCDKCMSVEKIPLSSLGNHSPEHRDGCSHSHPRIAGPIWLGRLWNRDLIENILTLMGRHESIVSDVQPLVKLLLEEEELSDMPYVDIHSVCDTYGLVPPPMTKVINALRDLGYRVSRTHFSATSLRTDAEIGDLVRLIEHLNGG
ncbi:MAG: hypothetical protein QXS20_02010 [Candidatus Thorarchaeota archaeon]